MVGHQCAVCGHEADFLVSGRCDLCSGKTPDQQGTPSGARALLLIVFMAAMIIVALYLWRISAGGEPCGWLCFDDPNVWSSVAEEQATAR